MKLLLDTHVVLWWRLDSPRLGAEARKAIASADMAWVSAASAWEVAIKRAVGKLRFTGSFAAMVAASEFDELPITLAHAEQVSLLAPHHADPFDRMLVAQARSEGLTLVTHDKQLAPYDVEILWA
jgi:PIN domain nuclease of toxin-antitoxin system